MGFGLRPKLDGDANAQEMAIPTRLYSDMATATSDQPSIERLRIDQHMKEQRESVFNCLVPTAIAWEQLFLGFFFFFCFILQRPQSSKSVHKGNFSLLGGDTSGNRCFSSRLEGG